VIGKPPSPEPKRETSCGNSRRRRRSNQRYWLQKARRRLVLRNAEAEAEAIARVADAMKDHGNPAQIT